MTFYTPLLVTLSVGAVAVASIHEVRAVERTRHDLIRLQNESGIVQQELTAARQTYQREKAAEMDARSGESAPASPIAATGDSAFDAQSRNLLERVYSLKKWLAGHPDQWTPEMLKAQDEDWLTAVTSISPWSNSSLPFAAESLKRYGQFAFFDTLGRALDRYLDENNGVLPTSTRELIPFFPGTCDEESLARYAFVAHGRMRDLPNDLPIIEETMSPAEREDADVVGVNFLRVRLRGRELAVGENPTGRKQGRAIDAAITKYQKSHAGDWPTKIEELLPYLSDPKVLDGVTLEDHGYTTVVPTR